MKTEQNIYITYEQSKSSIFSLSLSGFSFGYAFFLYFFLFLGVQHQVNPSHVADELLFIKPHIMDWIRTQFGNEHIVDFSMISPWANLTSVYTIQCIHSKSTWKTSKLYNMQQNSNESKHSYKVSMHCTYNVWCLQPPKKTTNQNNKDRKEKKWKENSRPICKPSISISPFIW